MNRRLSVLLFAAALAAPAVRARATDEPKEGTSDEKTESPDQAWQEIHKAQLDYDNALSLHGADSQEATKAKKKLDEEIKEHPEIGTGSQGTTE